jgi:DNA-binding transcriptional MerR regulator
MLIGKLVKATGLSKDAIRFYEKQGLITVASKDRRNNNYKEYSNEILQTLLTIKRLKHFGFTLTEVAEILEMIEMQHATCNNVYHKIREKVDVVDEKIRELMSIRNMLLSGAIRCEAGCNPGKPEENCPILISDNQTKAI